MAPSSDKAGPELRAGRLVPAVPIDLRALTGPPGERSLPSNPQPRKHPAARPVCKHCGAPLIDAAMEKSGFCCAGCAYVHRLVHESGLDAYYRIKDEITPPADATVFQPRDFSWLAEAQTLSETDAEAGQKPPVLELDLQGVSCAGCVWLIERLFQQEPGARDIEANAQLGRVRLRWLPGKFSATDFARKLQSFGYTLGPAGENEAAPESRRLVKRIGLCTAFSMNVMLFTLPVYFGMESTFAYARLFSLLSLAFGTLSLLVGGSYFLSRALRALREGMMHIDLPIAIGIIGAYLGSLYGWLIRDERFIYFDFVSAFILLMLVGRWAQTAAVERNRRRLLQQQAAPGRVRLADGCTLPVAQLRKAQSFIAPSGQTVPVDARLESAAATFSLASINGESEPRLYRAGQTVPSGAIHLGRADISLTALQNWPESLLAQLLASADRTQPRQLFLEKIIRGYLIGILVLALGGGCLWWFATGDALRTWSVVTAVLVVSCPCALGLALPLGEEMAIVALRRCGVFVRNEQVWARLDRVKKIVFDKTGTLTLETPVLQNPGAIAALTLESRTALHTLVRDNPHPLSQSLLASLLATGACDTLPGEPREQIGDGVELGAWALGRAGWRDRAEPAQGGTVFSHQGKSLAVFHFTDAPRAGAAEELAALQAQGFSVYILSGDLREKVSRMAATLGLSPTHAFGELTPQDKAIWLAAHAPHDALMLGDGANDSLAFDRALCRGTPVIHRGLLEQKADFYYLGRGLGGIRALFHVNRVRHRMQTRILGFSIIYNLLAVSLALTGHMNPLLAAILMPASSLLTLFIVGSSMRRAFKP